MQPRAGTGKSEARLAPGTWVSILLLGLAFCAFFYHFLLNQIEHSRDPDWSHAYLVPFISLYYIYENRRRILTLPARVNLLGLPLILFGVAAYFFFTFGPTFNHFFQGMAMVTTLMGVVLLMVGWRMWLALMFPMLYLIMGIRMPPRLLLQVTPTLQVWASKGSYYLLNMIGYDTDISGTVLTLYRNGQSIPLNVAEACAGMRMIVAFIALGIAIAFLMTSKWWQRIALVLLGVPVAILINVLRVTTLGVAATYNVDLAKGQTHLYIGMLWLIPAFLLYMGIVWVIQHLFIDGADSHPADKTARTAPPAVIMRSPSPLHRRLVPIMVALFAGGALGFAPAQQWLGVYLRKEPVPLRRQLSELPMQVGRWKTIGNDEVVSEEILREFGTEEYVTRNFAIDGDPANGILQLHVSYYTGGIDAVPHIPDRCYVGGGLTRSATTSAIRLDIDDSLWWPDPEFDPSDPQAGAEPYRMAQTSDQSRQVVRMPRLPNGLHLNAAEYWDQRKPDDTIAAGYLFVANGGVTASPEGVRLLAYDRSSEFAYYCKLQVTLQRPDRGVDRHELAAVASEFLSAMLPDLMSCLPDWWEVEHGQWPQIKASDDSESGESPLGYRTSEDAGVPGSRQVPLHGNG
ncbi:MAG: exosortase/archaeosortase family protein [Phycisphaerales bacterium]|nr:exosortase/archaeosortase family protein [Phycisphaerales bacterium]